MVNKAKFANSRYNIATTVRGIQLTDAIANYIKEKLSKVEHFTDKIIDVNVTLDVQKLANTASFVLKFLHFKIKASATKDDIYSAIDIATDKLTRLIRKYKTKLQNHRAQDLTTVDMKVNVLGPLAEIDEIEEINNQIEEENLREEEELYKPPKIVATERMPLHLLTRDEAIMKMELSNNNFLIYKGEEDRKLKVIYRKDGTQFGIVEVE